MTHIVLPSCIKCKYTDCVEVCPVDCFYEGENMLAIDPEVCIDCGVCVPECPIDAIQQYESDVEDETMKKWLSINNDAVHKHNWPKITRHKDAPADADDYRDMKDKDDLFSAKPGTGD